MTDAKPPDPPASPQTTEPNAETPAPDKRERVGTILMIVGITGLVILVLDVALKGKLLAPLFALLPAPKSPGRPETPDAPPRPPAE